MLVIGLTGGISSGKSTVSRLFAKLGVPVIDADRISRELVEPGQPLLDRIIERFGQEYLDPNGELDRSRLGKRIFTDQQARVDLEAILHPAIRQVMIQRATELDDPYAVLVIPLLVETRQTDMVDRVLVVDLPEPVQIERLVRRDNITLEEARNIIQSQASRQQRLAQADDVIANDREPADLELAVQQLHEKYLQLAASKES